MAKIESGAGDRKIRMWVNDVPKSGRKWEKRVEEAGDGENGGGGWDPLEKESAQGRKKGGVEHEKKKR